MSEKRITNLYDLMDSAYDAPEIHNFPLEHDRVPILKLNEKA